MVTELPTWAVRLRAERRNRVWSQKEMARRLADGPCGSSIAAWRLCPRHTGVTAPGSERAWLGHTPWPGMWRPPRSSRSRWLPMLWRSTATPSAIYDSWPLRCTLSARRAGSAFTMP